MPWIADQYLKWFSQDNKASYTAKEKLDKTKVTRIVQVYNLQDGVNNLAAGQVCNGGLLQPLGDVVSEEAINRAERGGKDEHGNHMPQQSSGMVDGASALGQDAYAGVQRTSGYVPEFLSERFEQK